MHYFLFLQISILPLVFSGALAQSAPFENLDTEIFDAKIQTEKGTLLDVRTPSEYANGHIAGAGQLNFYALDFKKRLLMLSKDQPIYLYCNTGYRSRKAAEVLQDNGYKKVYNLERGMMDWELSDMPVVVEADARPDIENKMEKDEFYALIQSSGFLFLDFYAPWCGPCRKMMPMIDSLRNTYSGKVDIVKINADASKRLIRNLEIAAVPHFVLYAQGEKVFEHSGMITRQELHALLHEL